MVEYVEIYYDKNKKTQRFVLVGANDCTSVIEKKLNERHITFTGHKFVGRYKPLENYKDKTYKYAKKWQWLNTIDLTGVVND